MPRTSISGGAEVTTFTASLSTWPALANRSEERAEVGRVVAGVAADLPRRAVLDAAAVLDHARIIAPGASAANQRSNPSSSFVS